jgi:hypothetical protein
VERFRKHRPYSPGRKKTKIQINFLPGLLEQYLISGVGV